MSDNSRTGELDFTASREQIEKEIDDYISISKLSIAEIPRFELEKGMCRFIFIPPHCDRELIFESLKTIKNHIENLRIHTFEPGYIIFQALGENLYDTKSIINGIKFKFTMIGSSVKVEISRKGNLIQDEIEACINIFKIFHPVSQSQDLFSRFHELGVTVYCDDRKTKGSPEKRADSVQMPPFAGYKKTRLEIRESIILPLRRPEIFSEVARITRGKDAGNLLRAILFEGPPGVGKTTMVRMIARETGIPLIYVPVENILSKFYGESAQNMAAIFDAAQQLDKVILFLDEIDSLAGSRNEGMFEATRRVLSVLLRKIDGFESRRGVLTIGATNRAQDLDHALLSRFGQTIFFPLPDISERAAILGVYARQLSSDELASLGEITAGLSGRNLEDICEYAERRWARMLISKKEKITAPPVALYREVTAEKLKQITLTSK